MTAEEHSRLLDLWDRELSIANMKHGVEYRELRALLIEKYGESGVCAVENKIRKGLGYDSQY